MHTTDAPLHMHTFIKYHSHKHRYIQTRTFIYITFTHRESQPLPVTGEHSRQQGNVVTVRERGKSFLAGNGSAKKRKRIVWNGMEFKHVFVSVSFF